MKKRKEAMKWWDRIPEFDNQLIIREKFGDDRNSSWVKVNEIIGLYEDYLKKTNDYGN